MLYNFNLEFGKLINFGGSHPKHLVKCLILREGIRIEENLNERVGGGLKNLKS